MSKILQTRNSENIIIVDTVPNRIDEEIFSSIILMPYEGSLNYSQITLLK